jgi:hypothetical protein
MNARTTSSWQRLRSALLVFLLITGLGIVTYTTGTRAASCGVGTIAGVQAIGDDGNVPANVLDNNLTTRWSHEGKGSWIVADLGAPQTVCGVAIAWHKGNERVNHFVVQGSLDGTTFVELYRGDSSGSSLALEQYVAAQRTSARFLRVVVNGNTRNDWASITELAASVVGGGLQDPPSHPSPTAPPAPPTATPPANPVPPTATPPANPAPPTGGRGIWMSREQLAQLPMSGDAWSRLKSAADGGLGSPNISDQDSAHDVNTLAAALVYARTGQASYRDKAASAIMSAIGTEQGGRTLALGRNLVSYVIAADLIDLRSYDAAKEQSFRSWLSAVRTATLDGKTLISTHEDRPNNWGTHAGASRVAADMYLGDTQDLARAAQVFKGWLGDRGAYAGFAYGELDWQADPHNPVGINPKGATLNGRNVDGVLPDDQRRAGGFSWPPQKENYVWEALQGAMVQAHLLSRAGYDVWNWSDRALLRAVQWEYNVNNFPATGDDTWQIWIVNRVYGTSFAAGSASAGKNMSYTDWMFSR